MDGIEVQRRIRLERANLTVIFISRRGRDKTRQRALKEGAVEFLYRTVRRCGLLEVIQAALTNNREMGGAFQAKSSKE